MIRHWKQMLTVATLGAGALLAAPAMAGVGVSIGINAPIAPGVRIGAVIGNNGYHRGGVGVVVPGRVYAPAPVVYDPYYPAPVAYAPPVYAPPVYAAPAVYVAPRVYAPYYRPVVRGPVIYPRVTYRPGYGHGPRHDGPGPRGGYGPTSSGQYHADRSNR